MNYARNFIFTTGPAFLTMATVKASYNVISSEEGEEVRRPIISSNLTLSNKFYREDKDFKLESASSTVVLLNTTFGAWPVKLAELEY